MIDFTPGTTAKSSEVDQNFTDLTTGAADVDANSLKLTRKLILTNFVNSGLTISTSASLTTNIAAGVAFVNGQYIATSLISKTFTASKDTYVFLKDDASISYPETTNGGTAPATVTNGDGSNALLIAIVATSVSAVTSVTQVGFDSLNRMIYATKTGTVLLKGATIGGGISAYFPDSTTSTGSWLWTVPQDYKSGDIKVRVFLRGGGTAANVRMQRNTFRFRKGVAFAQIDTNVASTIAATDNTTFEYAFTLGAANFQFGDTLRFDVSRLGLDGADTWTGTADLDGVWVEYNGRFI